MWYPTVIDDDAITEPLTSDDVKRQALIEGSDNDALIGRLIAAARSHAEAYCNLRLAQYTATMSCDSFADFSRLSEAPVNSVSNISYLDADAQQQTLESAVYVLQKDGLEPFIDLKPGQRWPTIKPGSRVVVTASIGYSKVPPAVVHAMLLWIADSFNQRENTAAVEWSAYDLLLCNFRRGV